MGDIEVSGPRVDRDELILTGAALDFVADRPNCSP